MKVSVIVPSRLRPNPTSMRDTLLVERALMSILRQSAADDVEIIVGLDAKHPPIPEFGSRSAAAAMGSRLRFVEAGDSQAKAVNVAMSAATGDVLAICEDDDAWRDTDCLAYHLKMLDKHDFVSCSQREVDEDGNFQRVNNFATPSGWVMKRSVWENVGGFDEAFRYHVDTEWLGRANKLGVNRCHLVPDGARDGNGWLVNVAKHSAIAGIEDITEPLIDRFVSEGGGMSSIAKDGERIAAAHRNALATGALAAGGEDERAFMDAALAGDSPFAVSQREHATMIQRFGSVPW